VRLCSSENVNRHAVCNLRKEYLSIIFRHICDNFVLLVLIRFQYKITREKLRLSQLVTFFLIWENASTSHFHLQANNIKYIKIWLIIVLSFGLKYEFYISIN